MGSRPGEGPLKTGGPRQTEFMAWLGSSPAASRAVYIHREKQGESKWISTRNFLYDCGMYLLDTCKKTPSVLSWQTSIHEAISEKGAIRSHGASSAPSLCCSTPSSHSTTSTND